MKQLDWDETVRDGLGHLTRIFGTAPVTVAEGRATLRARSDEVAARSAGVRARDYKVLAYAVAAFFAGIAGALQAHENRYLDPTLFTIAMSTLALTIIVVGGITSPVGAVVGSIVLIAVPELLRLTPDIRILLYGVVLIAVIRFRPQGLWVRRRA